MKYSISTSIFLLALLTNFAFAQSFRELSTEEKQRYPSNEEIMRMLERKADSVISTKNFLSPEVARKQLEDNFNKKVRVKRVKPNSKELSTEEIAKRLKSSSVIVADAYLCGRCDRTHVGPSSGYIIDESGIFVTNYHVVETFSKPQPQGAERLSLQVMTGDNKVYAVTEVLSANKDLDLAILKLDVGRDRLTPLPLGDDPEVGSEVFVLSNPHMMFDFFSKGIVARKYSRHASVGSKQTFPEMEITADFAAGSSGAAVVDNKCNVVSTVATTWSLYYDARNKTDLQMVLKGTKPTLCLKELLILE